MMWISAIWLLSLLPLGQDTQELDEHELARLVPEDVTVLGLIRDFDALGRALERMRAVWNPGGDEPAMTLEDLVDFERFGELALDLVDRNRSMAAWSTASGARGIALPSADPSALHASWTAAARTSSATVGAYLGVAEAREFEVADKPNTSALALLPGAAAFRFEWERMREALAPLIEGGFSMLESQSAEMPMGALVFELAQLARDVLGATERIDLALPSVERRAEVIGELHVEKGSPFVAKDVPTNELGLLCSFLSPDPNLALVITGELPRMLAGATPMLDALESSLDEACAEDLAVLRACLEGVSPLLARIIHALRAGRPKSLPGSTFRTRPSSTTCSRSPPGAAHVKHCHETI